MAYAGSNPGNLNGFKTKWMKERLTTSSSSMSRPRCCRYGIPFPALPQAPEIMNIIVPDMLQNASDRRDDRRPGGRRRGQEGRGPDGRRRSLGLTYDLGPAAPMARPAPSAKSRARHSDDRDRPGRSSRRSATRAASGMLRKIWEHRADYAYVLPAIVVMLIVIAYPIYYTIDLSFFKTPPGLQLRATRSSSASTTTRPSSPATCSGRSRWNTLIWTLASTFISFVLGFAAALALHRDFIGRGVLRAILIIPWVISAVAASYIWKWIYHSDFGDHRRGAGAASDSPTGRRTSSTASARCCPR